MRDTHPYHKQSRVPCKNVGSSTIPPYSAAVVTGVEEIEGIEVLKIQLPGTTFYRRWVLSYMSEILADKRGVCFAHSADLRVTYDSSGTPAFDEGWGPKASTGTLYKGHASIFTATVIHDSTNKWMAGRFHPFVDHFLGKTEVSVSAGAALSGAVAGAYKIYGGTKGSETDAGWTTVPSVWFRNALASGKWFRATWLGNGWEGEPLTC